MEDTLRDALADYNEANDVVRLNPCFNGRYSQRACWLPVLATKLIVLILVLMEDTLRGERKSVS